jgi:hypothetical protein
MDIPGRKPGMPIVSVFLCSKGRTISLQANLNRLKQSPSSQGRPIPKDSSIILFVLSRPQTLEAYQRYRKNHESFFNPTAQEPAQLHTVPALTVNGFYSLVPGNAAESSFPETFCRPGQGQPNTFSPPT